MRTCRAFLSLCFAKPMLCNPVAFTKTTGIPRTTAGLAEITDITKLSRTTWIRGANCRPKPRFTKTRDLISWQRPCLPFVQLQGSNNFWDTQSLHPSEDWLAHLQPILETMSNQNRSHVWALVLQIASLQGFQAAPLSLTLCFVNKVFSSQQ